MLVKHDSKTLTDLIRDISLKHMKLLQIAYRIRWQLSNSDIRSALCFFLQPKAIRDKV